MFTSTVITVFAYLIAASTAAINPKTSKGNLGTFTPAKLPARQATGGPSSVSNAQAATISSACTNWIADTGIVTNFLNTGKGTATNQFNAAALKAFNAETDELTQKGQLDGIFGNDPLVSIANLTLTDGSFQSVLDNLQIMSVQGKGLQNLIDTINNVRCTQILPSIGKLITCFIIRSTDKRRHILPKRSSIDWSNQLSHSSHTPNCLCRNSRWRHQSKRLSKPSRSSRSIIHRRHSSLPNFCCCFHQNLYCCNIHQISNKQQQHSF
jgi:hypothetical protein